MEMLGTRFFSLVEFYSKSQNLMGPSPYLMNLSPSFAVFNKLYSIRGSVYVALRLKVNR